MISRVPVRLALYDYTNTRVGVLYDATDISYSCAENSLPTLQFKYPVQGPYVDWLSPSNMRGTQALGEVIIEITSNQNSDQYWFEPVNGRFLIDSADYTLDNPTPDYLTLKLTGIGSRFDEGFVLPAETVTDENKGHQILTGTPGYIIRTVMGQAKDRGWGADIDVTFVSSSVDRWGTSWPSTTTVNLAGGTSLRTVLNSLVESGLIDWYMDKRQLQVIVHSDTPSAIGVTNTYNRNLSDSLLLPLTAGAYTAASESIDWSERCSRVFIEGEHSQVFQVNNSFSPLDSGVWDTRAREVYVKVQGVTTQAQAIIAAAPYLKRGMYRKEAVKRTYNAALLGMLPLREYSIGDFVNVERAKPNQGYYETRLRELMRITGLHLSYSGVDCKVDFTLGRDREAAITKLANYAKNSIGGVRVSSTSGSPSAPQEDKKAPTPKTPNQPSATQTMTPEGYAVLTLSTTAVSKDIYDRNLSGGTVTYEFQINKTTSGSLSPKWETSTSATTSADFVELIPGGVYATRCRAVFWESNTVEGLPRYSSWSQTGTVTILADTTAPPVPSAPQVEAQFRAAHIYWDGLSNAGTTGRVPDFDHLGVALVREAAQLRETHVFDGPQATSMAVAGLDEGTYDVAFRAYDTQGNVSAWSARTTFTSSATVDPQDIQDAVDTALRPLEDSIGYAVGLANAVSAVSTQVLVENWETPPSEGIVDTSYWQGPDGQWWILRERPDVD